MPAEPFFPRHLHCLALHFALASHTRPAFLSVTLQSPDWPGFRRTGGVNLPDTADATLTVISLVAHRRRTSSTICHDAGNGSDACNTERLFLHPAAAAIQNGAEHAPDGGARLGGLLVRSFPAGWGSPGTAVAARSQISLAGIGGLGLFRRRCA